MTTVDAPALRARRKATQLRSASIARANPRPGRKPPRAGAGLGFIVTTSSLSVPCGDAASFGLDFGFCRPYILLHGRKTKRAQRAKMIDEIYNRRVLELAADIPRLGRLAAPDASAKAHSRLCGSTVVVDLVVSDGRVVDFAHDVKACALGQASSSLMARHVIGASAEELVALRDTITRMLKANGPPPQGKWADFAVLEPVRAYKARHASTLLTFDAVADALGQIAVRAGRAETAPAAAT